MLACLFNVYVNTGVGLFAQRVHKHTGIGFFVYCVYKHTGVGLIVQRVYKHRRWLVCLTCTQAQVLACLVNVYTSTHV